MASTQIQPATVELREISWVAFALCVIGGFVLLLSVILVAVFLVVPPKNPPPAPWAPYVIILGSVLVLVLGIYLIKNRPVGLALKTNHIAFPRLGVSIPWKEIMTINVVRPGNEEPWILVMVLTPGGRSLIGNRQLSNYRKAETIQPRPDVCLKFNYWSFGPGIESIDQFVAGLRNRIALASGDTVVIDEPPPEISPDAPLELRDLSETGSSARVYVHSACGGSTVVRGGSFYWVVNPLRYAGGTVCARCGTAFLPSVRWQDTGEPLSKFRKRMWQHTPLFVKALHFFAIPALVGLASLVWFPAAPNIPPLTAKIVAFVIGYLAGVLVIALTPLAGIIPSLARMTYHKYR